MVAARRGSISMGMVLILISMYKATVDHDIHFNQLDKESKAGYNTRNIVPKNRITKGKSLETLINTAFWGILPFHFLLILFEGHFFLTYPSHVI